VRLRIKNGVRVMARAAEASRSRLENLNRRIRITKILSARGTFS
jgi:hypothetical protein